MARLAQEFDNIVAIKDSCNDLNNLLWYQRLCPPGFQIFTGQDTLIVDALVNDGAGAVSELANVTPTLTVRSTRKCALAAWPRQKPRSANC